ncbi:hypothetical protein V499_02293 [Pseudogymnoascus sp. VKM F-103]|uniref:Uncharacterized protein n=1 Tax=Pseudogymnoascus verrucosus TaxID=342668 RepID=A0A1B8GVW6_9PEZI|nr:uncharacterized protein VE01_01802 [Pseudogymnoascus verrucosus]KFY78549.1 hypothetical protein V499_02293 [Pseudogymnoascus sp. VKM F-103]OBT99940.1 hypothetical protein VE01_01802 [Pseudogymnoascus verrucosus]
MSGYDSDESMGRPRPLTPGLSETRSMQGSACSSEDQNSSPERSPKRRCTYNPYEPRLNGVGNHMASAASPPGHPTTSSFVPRSPVRSWTTPIPSSLRPTLPTPGLPCSTILSSGLPCSTIPSSGLPCSTVPSSGMPSSTIPSSDMPSSTISSSGMPYSTIPTPGSPRSFGQSREFLSLMLSGGLLYNRGRNPYPVSAMALAAERYSRVPASPTLRIIDWRMRLNSWPEVSRSQADAEMDTCEAALSRSSTW